MKFAAGTLTALLPLAFCLSAKGENLQLASGPVLTKSEGTISREVVITVEESSKPAQPEKPKGGWSVQVRAFSSRNESLKLSKTLQHKGYDAYVVEALVGGQTWYRVRIGNMATRDEAQALLKTLKSKESFNDAFLAQQ
jgi:cell division protein FtsN